MKKNTATSRKMKSALLTFQPRPCRHEKEREKKKKGWQKLNAYCPFPPRRYQTYPFSFQALSALPRTSLPAQPADGIPIEAFESSLRRNMGQRSCPNLSRDSNAPPPRLSPCQEYCTYEHASRARRCLFRYVLYIREGQQKQVESENRFWRVGKPSWLGLSAASAGFSPEYRRPGGSKGYVSYKRCDKQTGRQTITATHHAQPN